MTMPYDPSDPANAPKIYTIQLRNEQQRRIANHISVAYGVLYVWNADQADLYAPREWVSVTFEDYAPLDEHGELAEEADIDPRLLDDVSGASH